MEIEREAGDSAVGDNGGGDNDGPVDSEADGCNDNDGDRFNEWFEEVMEWRDGCSPEGGKVQGIRFISWAYCNPSLREISSLFSTFGRISFISNIKHSFYCATI